MNQGDATSHTPLGVAVAKGHSDVVSALIHAGVDVNRKSMISLRGIEKPMKPLDIAHAKKHPNLVELLKNAGATRGLGP